MRRWVPRRRRAARLAALLVAVAAVSPAAARAEGLAASVEPDYSHIVSHTTDQFGKTTSSTIDELAQHYRLAFDRTLYPFVRVRSLGLLDKVQDWTDADAGASRSDQLRLSGSAHLLLGPPVLHTELGYDRRDETSGSSLSEGRPHLVSETYSVNTGWRPADLPSLDLRLARTNTFDTARRIQDTTVDEAQVSTAFNASRQLDLRYSLHWLDSSDHLSATSTTDLTNVARASYADTFDGGRTAVSAAYTFQNRFSDTTVQGLGGTVATQQLPSAGLSLVETFPALPGTDTLTPNGPLIDGDTAASAGVNLGFSPALAGDQNLRDLGVQFVDPTTQVNTLFVWVDRQLPVEIASTYSWTAYRSDDNVAWTPVSLTAPVVFSLFQNRFEIHIESIQARYVKVVTKPLFATVTADRRFSDVFATELQAYFTISAAEARGHSSTNTQTANATLRRQLLQNPSLTYDFSGLLTSSGPHTSYLFVNGLSLDRRLTPALLLSARAARQDLGQDGQHTGVLQYSTSLAARPLPTLSHTLSYNGQYGQTPRGATVTNSVTLINHAELYRGVDALASLGYSRNLADTGVTTAGSTAIVTLSLVPHRALSLASTYFYSSVHATGGSQPSVSQDNERVDSSISFTPIPALYLGGTLTRVIKGARPTTLATFGGNFSPFPGGDVLFRLSYTESFDSSIEAKSKIAVAGVHWSIRAGTFLDVNYSLLDSSAAATSSGSRAFTASLLIQL